MSHARWVGNGRGEVATKAGRVACVPVATDALIYYAVADDGVGCLDAIPLRATNIPHWADLVTRVVVGVNGEGDDDTNNEENQRQDAENMLAARTAAAVIIVVYAHVGWLLLAFGLFLKLNYLVL